MEVDEICTLLNDLSSTHFSPGPIYQNVERKKVLLQPDELTSIYHLTESHAPGLRYKAIYRYEKNMQSECDNKHISINKMNIDFNCKGTNISENIAKMLEKIKEMPKEWVIVQLTPDYNPNENFETSPEARYTNALYVTIFHCGENQPKPFYIKINAPIDKISGKTIGIRQEMESIITDNKKSFADIKVNHHKTEFFTSYMDKHVYQKARYTINNRLKNLVKDIEDIWFKEWRCLFTGKLMDEGEQELSEKLETLLLNCQMYVSELIQLDTLPWEMLDVLQDHPVSRMPSLDFTYALFKEHEDSIVDGVKVGIDSRKGKYIINPGLDLKRMEVRLHNFYKYWTPHWNGIVGTAPSCEEFEELLLNSDIFSSEFHLFFRYNGHGNGSQYFSSDKIQRLRINSVVVLFGCGSVKYVNLGPQVEMFGSNQMYLIACSPCLVGMLWEVTDVDTDILATEFWSTWVPNDSKVHWKHIDKKKWESTGESTTYDLAHFLENMYYVLVESTSNVEGTNSLESNEPELLRVLCKAKKSACQFLTQASCVARGIPVKIK
ncbi:extra spindle poles 1-related [Holotrichia oblita]|uniref:Extra spindle poles 1-related n=1 Tax=Holotrichia oblita TaxID=644536 RepID=A0ACB9TMY8_HOLOL|nr:extra spindle poles 1-related [Holotrichia oblita]